MSLWLEGTEVQVAWLWEAVGFHKAAEVSSFFRVKVTFGRECLRRCEMALRHSCAETGPTCPVGSRRGVSPQLRETSC